MAKRKVRGKPADNVGRGSSDLVRVEKSGLAGQIPYSCLWDSTIYYVAINGEYRGNLFAFDGCQFIQQMFEPANSDPQRIEYTIANGEAKANPNWKNPLAYKDRMEEAKNRAITEQCAALRLRRVRNNDRLAGKQRAKPAMVGSRSKKASNRRVR